VNVSKSSDPERLNNICVANISDKATYFYKHGIFVNYQEFSDIEIFRLVLLENCPQTCMTYTIAECTVNKFLMMDR
jgi:hypothetical protein